MTQWRAGRSTGRTLWRDEQLVGMVDSPEIAAEIVRALNAMPLLGFDIRWGCCGMPLAVEHPDGRCPQPARERSQAETHVLTRGETEEAAAAFQRWHNRVAAAPKVVATAVCGACLREVGVTDDRRLIHHTSAGRENSYCPGSRNIADSPRPRDAERRSGATPQNVLDLSRTDPYDETKGYPS